jgi:hypothetical protein
MQSTMARYQGVETMNIGIAAAVIIIVGTLLSGPLAVLAVSSLRKRRLSRH